MENEINQRFWYSWDDGSFFCIYDNRTKPAKLLITWPGEQGSDDEDVVANAVIKLNTFPYDVILKRLEQYADNGDISHYDIVNVETGEAVIGKP